MYVCCVKIVHKGENTSNYFTKITHSMDTQDNKRFSFYIHIHVSCEASCMIYECIIFYKLFFINRRFRTSSLHFDIVHLLLPSRKHDQVQRTPTQGLPVKTKHCSWLSCIQDLYQTASLFYA